MEKGNAMLQAVIVDDELNAIESLLWELDAIDNTTVVQTFTDTNKAIDYINTHPIDVLFLDIEMPVMNGFQFLQQIIPEKIHIIFTTAHATYALEAFKHNAVDYLLKPIDSDDLQRAIDKVLTHYQKHSFDEILVKLNELTTDKKIIIKDKGQLLFFDAEEIVHAKSDGNYTNVYFSNGKELVISKKLKEVENILKPPVFLRVHNSHIINIEKISNFIIAENYLILDRTVKIPVSKSYKDSLHTFVLKS